MLVSVAKVLVLARTRATVCDWLQALVKHLTLTTLFRLPLGPVVLHSPGSRELAVFWGPLPLPISWTLFLLCHSPQVCQSIAMATAKLLWPNSSSPVLFPELQTWIITTAGGVGVGRWRGGCWGKIMSLSLRNSPSTLVPDPQDPQTRHFTFGLYSPSGSCICALKLPPIMHHPSPIPPLVATCATYCYCNPHPSSCLLTHRWAGTIWVHGSFC